MIKYVFEDTIMHDSISNESLQLNSFENLVPKKIKKITMYLPVILVKVHAYDKL
jgi:hypothetical protein